MSKYCKTHGVIPFISPRDLCPTCVGEWIISDFLSEVVWKHYCNLYGEFHHLKTEVLRERNALRLAYLRGGLEIEDADQDL